MAIFNVSPYQKMSGFGTKKPGGDRAVQLGFPAIYSEVASRINLPQRYAPSSLPLSAPAPVGASLQDAYHEQKRIDANRRAMNGVRDTAVATLRFLSSPAGYYGLPKPVLGQRRFANPSNGNQADIYPARRDMMSGGLRGGVLRTAEAQRWGRDKLKERSNQLDAIDAADASFRLGEMAQTSAEPIAVSQGLPESAGTNTQLEMVGMLQTISSAIQSGQFDRLTMSDYFKWLRLLFRVAAVSTKEELDDILAEVDDIAESVRGNVGSRHNDELDDAMEGNEEEASLIADDGPGQQSKASFISHQMLPIVEKTRQYMRLMIANVDKSPKERKAVSANAVRTLGFTSAQKKATKEINDVMDVSDKKVKAKMVAERVGEDPDFVEDVPIDARAMTGRFVVGSEAPLQKSGFTRAAVEREAMRRLREERRAALYQGVRAINERQAPARARLADYWDARHLPRGAQFDAAPRNPFGALQGAYFGEALPAPEGAVPRRNPRARGAVPLPVREVAQIAPAFPDAGGPRLGEFDVRGAIRRQMAEAEAEGPAARRARVLAEGPPRGFGKDAGLARILNLTRASLPKTREGYVELAGKLRGMGHNIRVNSGSQLKNIRQNFIKKLKL